MSGRTHGDSSDRKAMNEPGYWIEEGVFSPGECDEMLAALAQGRRSVGRAGSRHLMADARVARLARDERLLRFAERRLATGAVPFRATLFEKSGEANWLVVWHQDTALPLVTKFDSPQWGPWSCKAGILYAHAPTWALCRVVALRVHLDASTSENGPLRVVPVSHELGVLSDDEVFALARSRPSCECLVGRGGVVGMRPLLIHASSKCRSADQRRVLHIEYADSLDLAQGIRLAVA